MLRLSNIAGLTAVADGTGRRLGLVERAVLKQDGQDAEGLILRMNGFMRRRRFVPYNSIVLWGEVTVVVTAAETLSRRVPRREDVVGRHVLDTSGERLGWVTDALLEEATGRVLALEVSGGFLDDFVSGRTFVRDFTMRPNGVVAVTESAGGES